MVAVLVLHETSTLKRSQTFSVRYLRCSPLHIDSPCSLMAGRQFDAQPHQVKDPIGMTQSCRDVGGTGLDQVDVIHRKDFTAK